MMNLSLFFKYPKPQNSGFTLIEVLTVFFITTFIAVSLLTSILRTKPNLIEAIQVLMSDIRMVQANALASKQFQDPATGVFSYRCGYGLSHFNTTTSNYFLYAGRVNSSGSCSGTKIYTSGSNTPIFFTRILDPRLELVLGSDFRDVYFESPNGLVFINNNNCPVSASTGKSQIIIRRKGAVCPSADCAYVCVYAFGRIESRADACPNIAC